MRLEARINEIYDSLTANERELVSHILRDKQSIRGMNSTQLAQHLHVSRTTLVRFWKKINVQSYAEFRLLLTQEAQEAKAQAVELQQVGRMYHAMIDELPSLPYGRICQLLCAAPTIYIYGTGNEQKAIAEEFKRLFLLLGKCCVDLFDLGEVESARGRFQQEDVFVAISLSGEGAEALRVMRCVQAADIHTLSLTRWASNSLAQMCQESLYVGTKTIQQTENSSYEMVAAFYLLLDILLIRCLEQRRQEGPLPIPGSRRPAEVEALFNRCYSQLSENERYICQYISGHYDTCAVEPIADFAQRCSVSQALLVRFAQKLGLAGYGELKAMIRLGMAQPGAIVGDQLEQVTDSCHKMMDELVKTDLHHFFELFAGARRVFVYGSGSTQARVASEMKRIFLPLREIIHVSGHDMALALRQIAQPGDLVILISLSGESQPTVSLAEKLRVRGIPTVSVTGMRSNTLATLCTESLYIHSVHLLLENALEYETSTPYFILIEFLYLYYQNYLVTRDIQNQLVEDDAVDKVSYY